MNDLLSKQGRLALVVSALLLASAGAPVLAQQAAAPAPAPAASGGLDASSITKGMGLN